MNASFIWIILIAVILLLYSGFVYYRTRQKSRFQARLSILFFTLMLVPLLLLLLLFSSLFIKSANLMAPPGIESTLNRSLDIVRSNLNEKGQTFIQEHQQWDSIDTLALQSANAAYVLVWQQPGRSPVKKVLNPDIEIPAAEMTSIHPRANLQGTETQTMRNWGELLVVEYFHPLPDSAQICIGFILEPRVVASIRQINQLVRNYTTFRFLRDTVIEKHIIWILALALTLLLAFVSFQLAKGVSRGLSGPILELTRGMKIIGAGDLTHQVQVKAKDEIGYLVDSFNNMTTELRINRENLKKAERAAAWRDVARQISHEIKNPLTPIELSLYRLKSTVPADDPKYTQVGAAARIIEEEIASIRALAQSFSEFAKMPGLNLEPTHIGNIIGNSIELYQNYPIHYSEKPDLPAIHVDREQLRRAINNLIKNAIEATPDKKPLNIELGSSGDADHPVQIIIRDQGSGIEAENLRKIFKPYFTTKKEGTGLGLFIVNRIINEHGGNMKIDSEPGQGTIVTIIL